MQGESCFKGLSCLVVSTSVTSDLEQGYHRQHVLPFLHMLSRGTDVAAAQRPAPHARHPRSHHVCTLASLEDGAADEVEPSSAFFKSGLVECCGASLAW